MPNAGGKFGQGAYKYSGGLHGVGAKCVNALSDWFKVEVARDGLVYHMAFERGHTTKKLEVIGKSKSTGTLITFKPDATIFVDTVEFKFDRLAMRLRELRQYGWDKKYQVSRRGGRNSRLDEMQAAMLRAKLPYLDRWNEDRRQLANRYSREIQNPRVVVPSGFGPDNVAHLFVVRCEDRDGFRRHLDARGIASDVH